LHAIRKSHATGIPFEINETIRHSAPHWGAPGRLRTIAVTAGTWIAVLR
jgi:hypothetical protein